MSDTPLLSYIVLSYNYEHYIDQTIRSILRQTVQDFEIVVVDDCSKDNSVEVVKSFRDPRIRVLCNEKNLGGAGSYNRAVFLAARGEWLVNLDADDWIAPQKAEAQLEFAAQNPHLDIIGSYVVFLDADGAPHPNAEVLEGTVLHTAGSIRGRHEQSMPVVDDAFAMRASAWMIRNMARAGPTMSWRTRIARRLRYSHGAGKAHVSAAAFERRDACRSTRYAAGDRIRHVAQPGAGCGTASSGPATIQRISVGVPARRTSRFAHRTLPSG